MYPNMNDFGQMGNNMNQNPNKMEIINHLTNQNMIMQQQIQQNNILIQKLMNEIQQSQPSQNIGEFINIKFIATSGLTTVISTRKDIQINALLRVYMIRIGLENQLFNEDITFMYNAHKIDKNDTREINHPQIGMHNNSNITVLDLNNIIGKN